MKNKIKKLEEELERMRLDRDKWYGKYGVIEEEKKKRDSNAMFEVRKENEGLSYQIRNLLEIIRWQINPATTTSPFMATKEQRDEKNGGFNKTY